MADRPTGPPPARPAHRNEASEIEKGTVPFTAWQKAKWGQAPFQFFPRPPARVLTRPARPASQAGRPRRHRIADRVLQRTHRSHASRESDSVAPERMPGCPRQVFRRHPHRRLLRVPPSFAHCHRPQCSTRDRTRRCLIHRFTAAGQARSDSEEKLVAVEILDHQQPVGPVAILDRKAAGFELGAQCVERRDRGLVRLGLDVQGNEHRTLADLLRPLV